MSDSSQQGCVGDPNENTAVIRQQPRPPRPVAMFIIAVGILLAGAIIWVANGSEKLQTSDKELKALTAMTSANVALLQARMVLVEGRTGVLETRATDLEENARLDRQSAKVLAGMVGVLADEVDEKADNDELKKYARIRRIVEVEQKLDRYLLAVDAVPIPATVARDDGGAGTVTVKVVTVPVYPDEE